MSTANSEAHRLRDLVVDAGLGNTFCKMSRSALEKAITNAINAGEEYVKRGNCITPVEVLEQILVKLHQPTTAITGPNQHGLGPQAPAPALVQVPSIVTLPHAAVQAAPNQNSLPWAMSIPSSTQVQSSATLPHPAATTQESSLRPAAAATVAQSFPTAVIVNSGSPESSESDRPDSPGPTIASAVDSSCERPVKRRKVTNTKTQTEEDLNKEWVPLNSDFLTHYSKEKLQMQDFEESEQADFEAMRLKFVSDATARKEIGSLRFYTLENRVRARKSNGTERASPESDTESPESDLVPSGSEGSRIDTSGEDQDGKTDRPGDTQDEEEEGEKDVAKLLARYKITSEIYEPKPLNEMLAAELKGGLPRPLRIIAR